MKQNKPGRPRKKYSEKKVQVIFYVPQKNADKFRLKVETEILPSFTTS